MNFNFEMLKAYLTEAGKLKLDENIVIVAIVIWTVRGHFKKLEAGLLNVANRVGDLAISLTAVETKHDGRIGNLENRVEKLETIIKE